MGEPRVCGKSLSFVEEAFIFIFIFILVLLSTSALKAPSDRWPGSRFAPHKKRKEQIIIFVKGEVKEEGRYHFEKGVFLHEVINSLNLTDSATLKGLKQDLRVQSSRTLIIRKKKKTTIAQ